MQRDRRVRLAGFRPHQRSPKPLQQHNSRLHLEALEDRRLLSLTPQPLADLRSGTDPSSPTVYGELNGKLVFSGNDGTHGNTLWTTDGTAAGTSMLHRTVAAQFYTLFGGSLAIGSTMYFSGDDGAPGNELFKTDGTNAGTFLVKDIRPGAASSWIRNMTNVNGTLFFTALTDENGYELWKSDGTTAGTVLVKDIRTGLNSEGFAQSSFPSALTNVNGTLFFSANDGVHGYELWKSDGTEAGTVLVKDVFPGTYGGQPQSSNPSRLTNLNGTLLFAAGFELWRSDGTEAGTVRVAPTLGFSVELDTQPVAVGNYVYFAGSQPDPGTELWKSDGTDAGTMMVKDIYPGAFNNHGDPDNLVNVDGTLFFFANDADHGRELWMSDGTEAGTVLFSEVVPGPTGSSPDELTYYGGVLYFTADDGIHGRELFREDGSGPQLVKDIRTGLTPVSSGVTGMKGAIGSLYFKANDGTHGTELWRSDGTEAGTVMVKDLNTTVNGDSFPSNFTHSGANDFFVALDGVGMGLYKSDGTTTGTALVREFAYVSSMIDVGGTLFLAADDGVYGREIWRSDGTAAGTVMVKNIKPDIPGDPFPGDAEAIDLTVFDGKLLFIANDGTHGRELWTSDGTESGTTMVTDGNWSNYPRILGVGGTTLFLTVGTTANGRELWSTDGTPAGTNLFKDIRPGNGSSNPGGITQVGSVMYFTANDGTHGTELWKTDGTSGGTVMVKDINPSATASGAARLANASGTLLFFGNDGSTGYELWKSDGTEAGTVLVKDIWPGSNSSDSTYTELVNVNGSMFFNANDGTTGRELWKSDGTTAGTVLVKDINSGSLSNPLNLVNVNGSLFFIAIDGVHGKELWRSLGTAATTTLVKDINPSTSSSVTAINNLTNLNGKLYFSANDSVTGREPWILAQQAGFEPLAVTQFEGNAGTSSYVFTVTLAFPSSQTITVDYQAVDGSATAGSGDYVFQSGNLTFAPGETAREITVVVNGDLADEPDETFSVVLSNPTNVAISEPDASAIGTLLNDDLQVSIAAAAAPEGNSGATPLVFTASLSAASTHVVTVAYATSDGTATNGGAFSDYNATSGTLTFAPGQTTATATVTVVGDTGYEPDETLTITLSNPTSVVIGTASAVGTIQNDDLVPTINFVPAAESQNERNSGSLSLFFSVRLSSTSYQPITVEWSTADGTATLADNDYQFRSATLTFAPFVTFHTVTVPVVGDTKNEANETFTVNLANPTNSTLGAATATGMITNDDAMPSISISGPAPQAEGNSGTTPCTFTLTLSAASGQTVTVRYATQDGTATLADNDFQAAGGTVTFAPGQTSILVTVLGVGDSNYETDETFSLSLSSPANATLASSSAAAALQNDDPLPTVSIQPTAGPLPEGDSTTTPIVFTVKLSVASVQIVTVHYATADGNATTADNDYQAALGMVTFAPGQTAQTVTVQVVGDTKLEDIEYFSINLDSPTNAILGSGSSHKIANDDHAVAGARLFYKGSTRWNIANGVTFSDDNAIAPDKTAYLPGSGTSAFSAVSSYSKGINGLMVDLGGPHGLITAADFIFKVGNNNSPGMWGAAPAPASVTTRPTAGELHSDRIELAWADNAIQKQWLEVIVAGNDALGGFNTNSGLASSYVFYFGNAIGDSGASDGGAFAVTSADEIAARNDPHGIGNPAAIDNVDDFDRNGLVDSSDQIIARNNATALSNQLKFLVVGAGGPFAPAAESVGAVGSSSVGDSGIASGLASSSMTRASVTAADTAWAADRLWSAGTGESPRFVRIDANAVALALTVEANSVEPANLDDEMLDDLLGL